MAKTTKKIAPKSTAKTISADADTTPAKKKVAKKAAAKKVAAKPAAKKVVKKTAAKKAVAKKHVATKKPAAKKAAAKAASAPAGKTLTAQERHQMIAQAAYLRSESQGFAGDSNIDWIQAEAEVDARLAAAGIAIKG